MKTKKYRLIYKVSETSVEISLDINDSTKKNVKDRFTRLFPDLKIIKIEEVK